MLIKRVESPSTHTYFSSDIGVSDWITRNFKNNFEMQTTIGYQNYCLLMLFKTDNTLSCLPSMDDSCFSENKIVNGSGGKSFHEIKGRYTITCDQETLVTVSKVFLESMRGVRIYQEGSPEIYNDFFKDDSSIKADISIDPKDSSKIKINRQFHDVISYSATIICDSGEFVLDNEKLCEIILAPGNHNFDVNIFMQGIWPDEDFSSYAKSPIDLLKPEYKKNINSLTVRQQEEVDEQLQALSTLSRRTKLLAGGPRFFTYFGRDSLISISLLSGIVNSELTLHGIRSILERTSEKGEVAHEETLGEFSLLLQMQKNPNMNIESVPEPGLEYIMVDDDFLLPSVIRRWIDLEDSSLMKDMLEEKIYHDKTGYELLAKNLEYCLSQVEKNLVPYHREIPVGDWRDSLAHQRIEYSYEVNQGLARFFIQIMKELISSLPKLNNYLIEGIKDKDYSSLQNIVDKENKRYLVKESLEDSREKILSWLKDSQFSKEEIELLTSRLDKELHKENEYSFYAMALDSNKEPIKVQHNDVAFSMLYGYLNKEEMDIMLKPLETEFPLGLKTDIGILVSNPLFCEDRDTKYGLNRSHYHGLVIWPFMHNVLYHGLVRQRKIFSNDKVLTTRIDILLDYLLTMSDHLEEYSASELLTFVPTIEGDKPQAFGATSGSRTESNPIQLWSSLGFTTYLDKLIRS